MMNKKTNVEQRMTIDEKTCAGRISEVK